MDTNKHGDDIPEVFGSYEEAAEFWDAHDTTNYLDVSHPVDVQSEFRGYRYEVELEDKVAEALRSRAKQQGTDMGRLANDLLRRQLAVSE